jgi:hypothetical protein
MRHGDTGTDTVGAVNEDTAARYIDVSIHYLRASRLDPPRCDGPPFVRLGRAIRYRLVDLDRFLAARVVTATRDRSSTRPRSRQR